MKMKPHKNCKLLLSIIEFFLIVFLASVVFGQKNSLQFGESRTVKNKKTSAENFLIKVSFNQIISIDIKQNGMDVAAKLFDAQNTLIAESDNPFSEQDTERIYVTADQTGNFNLKIYSKFPDDEGSITIKLNEAKTAEPNDMLVAEAEKLFSEAQILRGTTSTANREKALLLYEQSLKLQREASDKIGEIRTLAAISYLSRIMGKSKRSNETAELILQFPELPENAVYQADALYQIGQIFYQKGDRKKAIETFQKALSLFAEEAPEQANLWTALGNSYQLTDKLELAEEAFEKALENSRKFPDMYNEAQARHQRGQYYFNYNFHDLAIDDFKTAAALRKKFGNLRGYANSLTMQAMTLQSLEHFAESIEPLETAFPVSVQIEDYVNQVDTLVYLARAYREMNNFPKALELFQQAIAIDEQQKIGQTNIALTLGATYLRMEDFQNARINFEKSLEFFRKKQDTHGVALTLYQYAYLEREENKLDAAFEKIEKAVRVVDSAVDLFTSPERLASFLANRKRYFDLYIDVLMRLDAEKPNAGYSFKALQVNELSRMRTFLWYYREAIKNTSQAADFEILTDLEKNRQKLGEKLLQLADGQRIQAENTKEIEIEISELNKRIESLKARLREKNPNLAGLAQPPILSLAEMQAELDDETVLVEYALGEKQSYLWIIGKNDFQSYKLPKRAEIDKHAVYLYETLTQTAENQTARQADKTKKNLKTRSFKQESENLSRLLLTEKFADLKAKRLVIVGDGALNFVPFSALKFSATDEKFIGDKFEVSKLPSLTTLNVIRNNNAKSFSPKNLAVIADPVFALEDERLAKVRNKKKGLKEKNLTAVLRDFNLKAIPRLPFSRIEAENIAASFPEKTNVNLDFKASRERILNGDFDNFDIIHFATHGFLNDKHPELSGLVLSLIDEKGNSQNGFLRTQDLYLLKLKSQLVVLSACQTGLGKQLENEGLIGLTRGFMVNGTPRVVSTLWKVDDAATAEFMKRFYRAMLKENQKPSEALQTAQNEIKAIPRYSNPRHWAGFILTGEWR